MNTAMLGLLAETPVHPGAGRGMGVVDLPVAREASTDYPVLVGSSLKGALRDKAEAAIATEAVEDRFGTQEHAGDVLVSDGRLLLAAGAESDDVVPLGHVSAISSSATAATSTGPRWNRGWMFPPPWTVARS